MKWFVIILLIINLVYFGWELDRQTRIDLGNASEAIIVPRGVKNLALVRELSRPPEARQPEEEKAVNKNSAEEGDNQANETSTFTDMENTDVKLKEEFVGELMTQMPDISSISRLQDDPANRKTMCFSYGPFPDKNQSRELMDWFQQNSVDVLQRLETGSEKQLFWIYLEPGKSRSSAMQAIEDLKNKGVSDYRLIETGDLRNAISLGLYSTQASVNKRLNELRTKGYQAVVVPYTDANAIYWLDVKLVGQQDVLNKMFTEYPTRYNSVPVNCNEIALQ